MDVIDIFSSKHNKKLGLKEESFLFFRKLLIEEINEVSEIFIKEYKNKDNRVIELVETIVRLINTSNIDVDQLSNLIKIIYKNHYNKNNTNNLYNREIIDLIEKLNLSIIHLTKLVQYNQNDIPGIGEIDKTWFSSFKSYQLLFLSFSLEYKVEEFNLRKKIIKNLLKLNENNVYLFIKFNKFTENTNAEKKIKLLYYSKNQKREDTNDYTDLNEFKNAIFKLTPPVNQYEKLFSIYMCFKLKGKTTVSPQPINKIAA